MIGTKLALALVVAGVLLAPVRTLADNDNPLGETEDGKYQLIVKVAEGSEGRGTVSGSGYYLPGEIVTLKATPKKGYYFSGWAIEDEGLDEFMPESSLDCQKQTIKVQMPSEAAVVVAKFVTAREDNLYCGFDVGVEILENGMTGEDVIVFSSTRITSMKITGFPKGMTASLFYTGGSYDVGDGEGYHYYGLKFAKVPRLAPGAKYNITLTVKNAAGKTKTAKAVAYAPNRKTAVLKGVLELETSDWYCFTAGVKFNWEDLGISVKSGWKITKVTGLPSGMKWNGAKQRITGVPAKKGRYTVMFTVSKGKTSYQASATFWVEALPSGVAGTYNGFATYDYDVIEDGDDKPVVSQYRLGNDEYAMTMVNARLDSYSSNAKITVTSAGKVTAKIGGMTFTGTGLTYVSDGKYRVSLKKSQKITSGTWKGCTKSWMCEFEIDSWASWDSLQLNGVYQALGHNCAPSISAPAFLVAQRNPYGKNSKKKYVNAAAGKIASRLAKYGSMKTKCGMEGTGVYGLVGPICGEFLKSSALFFKVNSAGVVSVSGKIGRLAVAGSSVLRVAPTTWEGSAWPPYEIGDYDEELGDYRREWTVQTCLEADFCLTVSKKPVRIHIEFNPENGMCRHGWATVGHYRWDEYRGNDGEEEW